MTKWKDALLQYGKIAYETGQRLEFAVIKRFGERRWRINLTRINVEHGEDKVMEED